jgi:predicted O-linked N-acetylglucosamine transferase (SPINDLY family)
MGHAEDRQLALAEAALQAGDFEAAQRQFATLVEGAPGMARAHARFAYLERQFGRMAPSLAAYRRALELDPGDAETGSSFLLALNYSDAYSREEVFAEHRRFAERHAAAAPLGPPPESAGARRLRIGYVSPDFRSHVVASFAMPILARHDRGRFEVFCYYTYPHADAVTKAMRGLADHFADCHGDSPAALAARIRADRIDILVDLAGHAPGNSLQTFALKPAPLQATYLGYPNTTGLAAIDYRLTDAIADPPGDAERFHAERIVRLPKGFLCYRPGPDVHEVVPLPAARDGRLTFGCFNNFQKLSPAFFRAAQRILAGTPGSRLLLKGKPLAYRTVAEAVRKDFARAGIDAQRLELRGWEPAVEAHLGAYGEVDIALDSFPYNGTTTTCEALWMGAPVVTLRGDRHAARVGASLLHAVGLDGLVAKDQDDYVRVAVELARDPARLRELRSSLRERMRRSPLMDESGFVRDLEASYLGMWRAKWEDEPARDDPLAAKLTCARILLRLPGDLQAATRLWHLCNESRDHSSAVAWLRRAVAAVPRTAKLHYMLGCALEDSGRQTEAIASYRDALANDPSLATAANNLGCLLELSGDLQGAAPLYEKAIAADPALAHAHYNLGNLHKQRGRPAEAEKYLRAALERDPGRADWTCNLGEVLLQQWQLDEAQARFRDALARDGGYAPAHNGLGNVLQACGRSADAEACFRRALDNRPAYAEAHSNLLLNLHYHRGDDGPALYKEHLAWQERHAKGIAAAQRRHTRGPDALRIGYVSPDFRHHAVASFIEPVLAAHDRRRHRIFCYANVGQPDATTARLHGLCDEWRDIRALGDDEAARRIAEDGIDVLVDLAGHTGGGRLLLFARKPAAVQVSWLGYPDTTGLTAMDFRLTDRHADPEGCDAFYTEKLVRLEQGFLCYGAPANAPDPSPGAPSRGGVAFGSFNNLAKVTPATLRLWARILAGVPRARLVVKAQALASQGARVHLAEAFSDAGGDPSSLHLLGPEDSPAAHLGRYREIDIALDTFPYHGTTTTCEALWMGVPVVSLAGPTHVSRVGASILAHAGLAELVAATPGEYEEKAIALARDTARLAALRAGLRGRVATSALLDRAGFARALEAAYAQMVRSR